ncbi:hypothetical protein GCM10023194_74160 [Planotetraspora phitsanulokensis]|uniref:Knr4/Smi1-like domain-containing protein n=1 Tax=Planotetraspora phitsanulokensis TaxID=575192 RepID=A0A8J3XDI1_9ACTN|nr:SMI1/KNR4 family protein [Planotetraspora phitsanulokensis]GII37085.1 hypothetical protein Pph01_20880 [Planotetraspora phitsanulokensis]
MWNVDHILSCLATIAAADPEHERFGAKRHRYALGPILAEAEIDPFEAEHGVTLPEAYREFLTVVGDGGAGPHPGMFTLAESEIRNTAKEDRQITGFPKNGNASAPFLVSTSAATLMSK